MMVLPVRSLFLGNVLEWYEFAVYGYLAPWRTRCLVPASLEIPARDFFETRVLRCFSWRTTSSKVPRLPHGLVTRQAVGF